MALARFFSTSGLIARSIWASLWGGHIHHTRTGVLPIFRGGSWRVIETGARAALGIPASALKRI